MTPFGSVKPYILHSSPSWLEFPSFDIIQQYLKGIIFNPGCNIKTIYNTASTYRSSSVSRFSMTLIEGLRLLLDMATVDKTESSK